MGIGLALSKVIIFFRYLGGLSVGPCLRRIDLTPPLCTGFEGRLTLLFKALEENERVVPSIRQSVASAGATPRQKYHVFSVLERRFTVLFCLGGQWR